MRSRHPRRLTLRTYRRAWRGTTEPLERRTLMSVFYVDDTAAGPVHDGGSWAGAYTDLQAALDAAAATAGADEVRVAAGTYRPTTRTDASDPRSATFRLLDGVSLLGGYPDGGGAARAPAAPAATLSGDIGARGSAADNSYHVVLANGVGATAVLDGFTVTGGNGDVRSGLLEQGGGMLNLYASPTVARCTFADNFSFYGGGMRNLNSSPSVTGCRFTGNSGARSSAMDNELSAPRVTDCTFDANRSSPPSETGAVFNYQADAVFTRCTFSNNPGGAVSNYTCEPVFEGCSFVRNSAFEGAAMFNYAGGSPLVRDCTFEGNVAGGLGGAMMSWSGSAPTVVNSVFSGNSAPTGGATASYDSASPRFINCTFSGNSSGRGSVSGDNTRGATTLINCVAWGNAGAPFSQWAADKPVLSHTFVPGGWAGDGNLSADPMFVRSPSPGADGTWGTADDDYGDLRLRAGSPAVDAGDTGALPAGVTIDLAGAPRVQGLAVDAGAYEQASDTEVYNGHLYWLIPGGPTDWAAGETQARQAGGHLVTVNDAQENDFLVQFARRRVGSDQWTWIGLTDDPAYGGFEAGDTHAHPYPPAGDRGSGWVWAGGEPVTYQNWDPQQPDNRSRSNFAITNFGRPGAWDDVSAATRAYAVAEQPLPPPPVVYEAEGAAVAGAAVARELQGFGGTGYVDFLHPAGDAVEFAVDVPSAGTYELRFRYANGGKSARTVALGVGGADTPGGVIFSPTGSWEQWGSTGVNVPLAAGRNTVRLTATGQSGPNLDSLAVRPVASAQPLTYQAESATLAGPAVASNVPGYTGSGFADYQHGTGDAVEFAIDVPAGGAYALDFRYANGSTSDRPLELIVDGAVLTGRLSFAPTGSWQTWKDVVQPAALSAGRHVVRLTSVGSNGPNLDALTLTATPAPPAPVTLQAESALLSGPAVASNVPGFTGSGFADYQHSDGDSVEWAVNVATAGTYRLAIRYANGSSTDRALDLAVNGVVVRPQVSFAPTGGWSVWKTVTLPVPLAAGTSKVRLTSIGFNGPNIDSLIVPGEPSGTLDPSFDGDGVVGLDLGANAGD